MLLARRPNNVKNKKYKLVLLEKTFYVVIIYVRTERISKVLLRLRKKDLLV